MRFFVPLALVCTSVFATPTQIEDKNSLEIKSPHLQDRKTTKIQLPNGVQAYLVSDPGLSESAALIAVNSGSLDDPQDALGIAHFLEHMLFMGTEKYPDEEGFASFVQDNGGSYNAFTAGDRTAYLFSINNKLFPEAFDRMSHFFIDPLLSDDSLERERNAVDQEHGKNIENDGWRNYLVLKELADTSHPFSQFSTGTLGTLSSVTHEDLKQHFDQHYSANLMRVVVYSPLPLQDLEALVTESLEPVVNKNLVATDPKGDVFPKDLLGKMVYIEPFADHKSLEIIWQVPKEFTLDNSLQISEILNYVLSANEPGTALQLLKQKGWAHRIVVEDTAFSQSFQLVSIDVDLTKEGIQHVEQVIGVINEALTSYSEQTLPKYVFEDVQKTQTLNWEYQLREDGFHKLYHDAHVIFNEDLETFPQRSTVVSRYDSTTFQEFVSKMTLSRAVFVLNAPKALVSYPLERQEQWAGASYSIVDLNLKEEPLSTQIAFPFPEKNEFIPSHVEDRKPQPYQEPVPTLIEDSDFGKVYYAKDTAFYIPKVSTYFRFKTPSTTSNLAKTHALNALFAKAFREKMWMPIQQAKAAGFKIWYDPSQKGLTLYVEGWQSTAKACLLTLFEGMQNVEPTKDEFNKFKQRILSKYNNFDKEAPIRQGLAVTRQAFLAGQHLPSELAKVLETITYKEFIQFSKNVFKNLYVEGVILGGLDKSSAESWKNELLGSFASKPYPANQHRKIKRIVLPEDQGPFEMVYKVDVTGDATVLSIQDGSDSQESKIQQRILTQAIAPLFFDELRSQQQTGYIVRAQTMPIEDELLTTLFVQSKSYSAEDLLVRFDLFLENFVKNHTKDFDENRFESLRSALVNDYQKPLDNMTDATYRFVALGFDYNGDFNRIKRGIQILDKMTYPQIQQAAEKLFSKNNRRRLAVLVKGKKSVDRTDYKQVRNPSALQRIGKLTAISYPEIIFD